MSEKHFLPRRAPLLFGAKKKGQHCVIVVDRNGFQCDADFIGTGRFTTAFRVSGSDDVILYTFYNDRSKSILAQAWREFGRTNPHIPRVTRVGQIEIEGLLANVYKARHYHKVIRKYLTPENKRIVEILQEAQDEAQHEHPYNIIRSRKAHEFNQLVVNAPGLPTSIKLALEHLAEIALDWGDHYIFDKFQLRNLGLDGRGRLVLIDPMFDMAKVQRDYDYRRKYGVTTES